MDLFIIISPDLTVLFCSIMCKSMDPDQGQRISLGFSVQFEIEFCLYLYFLFRPLFVSHGLLHMTDVHVNWPRFFQKLLLPQISQLKYRDYSLSPSLEGRLKALLPGRWYRQSAERLKSGPQIPPSSSGSVNSVALLSALKYCGCI